MHAVVSLLDQEHEMKVRDLWAELEREVGTTGIQVTPYPHFSYQVAARYNRETVLSAMKQVAARTRPFKITTGGLGIFTLPAPVLYLPIIASTGLAGLHGQVWAWLSETVGDASPFYRPGRWIPHITLAEQDLTGGRLGRAVELLAGRSFNWEISISTLGLIWDDGTKQELQAVLPLGE